MKNLSRITPNSRRIPTTQIIGAMLGIFLGISIQGLYAAPATAAVINWQKGISLNPEANNDFSSQAFRKSLTNAAAIHANMATFIVPYYQLTDSTTDIQIGWNTPTDTSLIDGITYAHSLGMQAAIKIHLSPYYGNSWAAYINPPDRAAWFSAYGELLSHYAQLAETNGVEQLFIGNELTSMTTYTANPDNTAEWKKLIAATRLIYHGSLLYNANRGGDSFSNEKDHIAFWQDLNAIGLSAYFELSDNLAASWDLWNVTDIAPLYQKYSKPIIFTEIGYRSVDGAHVKPWDFTVEGRPNMQEQADDYAALFQYWNNSPSMQGINVWDWETNPNAGGLNNTDYTIQNKPAQTVVSNWFSGATR